MYLASRTHSARACPTTTEMRRQLEHGASAAGAMPGAHQEHLVAAPSPFTRAQSAGRRPSLHVKLKVAASLPFTPKLRMQPPTLSLLGAERTLGSTTVQTRAPLCGPTAHRLTSLVGVVPSLTHLLGVTKTVLASTPTIPMEAGTILCALETITMGSPSATFAAASSHHRHRHRHHLLRRLHMIQTGAPASPTASATLITTAPGSG